MHYDYQGKHIFVAGGTSGINLGIAQGFAAAGGKLSVLSRKQEKVEAAVQLLQSEGGEAGGYAADVRDYDAVAESLKQAREARGEIDVLISGAAGNFIAPALGLSANAFKTVVDIDLLGTFNVLRAGYEYLHKPGAAVINITAPQAWLPTPLQVHACAAKAGMDQLTRTLAMEWGPAGVRVNAIAPGPIEDTEGMRKLAPPSEAAQKRLTESIPLRRNGKKQDIARAALWLASEEASYVNGIILPVDGGWSLGGSLSMFAMPDTSG